MCLFGGTPQNGCFPLGVPFKNTSDPVLQMRACPPEHPSPRQKSRKDWEQTAVLAHLPEDVIVATTLLTDIHQLIPQRFWPEKQAHWPGTESLRHGHKEDANLSWESRPCRMCLSALQIRDNTWIFGWPCGGRLAATQFKLA